VTTAADRRRRPFALAVAALVLAVAFALALRVPSAHAACPLNDPLCDSGTTTTLDHETTTSLFDETPTSEADPGTDGTTRTTARRTTATTEPTTTTQRSVTVITQKDLLVPGDGTKGAESTTTTIERVAVGKKGPSDDQLIVLVVAGLAVMSLALALLTWRYWSATRPVADDRRPSHAGRG
jgi:cobalamin biosynthesis Mg chelatase CobN